MKCTLRTVVFGSLFLMALSNANAEQLALLTPTGDQKDIPATTTQQAKKATDKKVKKGTRLRGCSLNAGVIRKKAQAHAKPIGQYAQKYGVNADIIRAVIAVESCYNRRALSPKGAQGLMQLIPATAERFGVSDAFNSQQNIRGGTRYLSWLLKRYKGDLYKSIAAYNAGEGAVDRYKGIPPYKETQNYVRKVLTAYNRLSGDAVPLPAAYVAKGGKKGVKVKHVAAKPVIKALTGKPGRGGWQATKAKAPHLFKR